MELNYTKLAQHANESMLSSTNVALFELVGNISQINITLLDIKDKLGTNYWSEIVFPIIALTMTYFSLFSIYKELLFINSNRAVSIYHIYIWQIISHL